ncbi:NlpC/P60 family protein [Actinoallomurus spadix]|uniref:C40 family peptidase n=1 Tax=Actinoallomurus spadix TaxID=79912 RepID=UPI002091F5C8|nr:C40 family peptidase [Actinoallomurus spadix]MCO5985672.1 NlpC/P60 family protein [Actinoallomurus spadix]
MATQRSADGPAVGRSASGWIGGRVLATLCVAASAAVVLPAGTAEAKPKQTLSQAKARLTKLNSQVDHLANDYNKAKERWSAADKQVKALNASVKQQRKSWAALRVRVAQMAASAYKNGSNGADIPTLLSAKDPQTVLDQMSAFTALSKNRSTELAQFLNASQLLQRQQAQAQQASADLAQKRNQLSAEKKRIEKSVKEQKALVDKLTPKSSGGGDDSGPVASNCSGGYHGSATGKARVVLEWAYGKCGTPYLYGGTGPRYDCSGFTMKAYAAAGVSIPRVVPDQYNATSRVSRGNLSPGDLVFFDDLGHVGIYVGGGKFIHSPHTGSYVKIDSLSNVWYSSHYVGAGAL